VSLVVWAGLAAATFAAALLQAASGFGFAVVAAPLYLLLLAPVTAVQLVVIIAAALTVAVLPGLWRAVAPRVLAHLVLGSLAGVPLGLFVLRHSDPTVVRVVAGLTVLGFAAVLALQRRRGRNGAIAPLRMSRNRDLAAGATAGMATALVGMAGPPVLIYLMLAGNASQTIRATLLAFFSLVYAATLAANAGTIGVSRDSWLAAGVLLPFAIVGGVVGRALGDRLGGGAFARLAIGLLAAAGLVSLGAAAGLYGVGR
jgi:uncharacterized membrane protein YfcA